jgi:hypothetical protein
MAGSVRVAEVVATLSLATDLGTGVPEQRALRACLLAVRLGELIGLDEPQRKQVYFVTQLAMLGCTADSTTMANVLGDELVVGAPGDARRFRRTERIPRWVVRNFSSDQQPLSRAASVARLFSFGVTGQFNQGRIAHCEVAQRLASRLGLGADVLEALGCTFEYWDGTAGHRLKGEAIPIAVRVGHVACEVELGERLGGPDAAVDLVRQHRYRRLRGFRR